MPANILLFGAGGVGCTYAAILEKGGASVTTVCRSNYNAVKTNGLLIRSALWGHLRTRPNAVQTVEEASRRHGPFDFVVVTAKAFPGTADLIAEAVTPHQTAIVLAQNGIAIEEEYAEKFPQSIIISGSVYLPTTQVEPGVVEHGPLEMFEIGTYPATSASAEARARVKLFSDLFAAGGAHAPIYENVQERKWNKLSVNACFNSISALTLCDDANFLRSSPYAIEMSKEIMREVAKVAAAAGYPDAITPQTIAEQMGRHVARLETGGKEPSMLVDIRHGRPIEVEAIMGNLVRKAEQLHVETPNLKLLYILTKARDFATLKTDGWKPIAAYD